MKEFPRFKVCGGCLNARALDLLDRAGLEVGGAPLHGVRLAAGGRRAMLSLPAGAALSRERLDTALAREAEASGVTFAPGNRAEIVETRPDACTLRLHGKAESATVEARLVVAADGLAGRTLERAEGGTSDPARDSRIGAGCVVDAPAADFEGGTIHMACGTGGYVGLVRLEDGRLNVAAAFDRARVQRRGGFGALAVRILQEAGLPRVDELGDAHWRGTPQLTRRRRSAAAHRCIAVGDAAGYVEPFTGEGMAWAMESGAAAGALAIRALDTFDAGTEREWNRTRATLSAASERRCRLIAMALRRPRLVRATVGVLSKTPRLAAPVIARLNRAPGA